ncbi:lytic transglycosylase domain-containing protein [Paracoccus mutanolyticus]|uniref:Lytic transglycosylase domain-containing protein n=1 Tax=Paracoccus mutanolyticus TaxID=1499308 RepID=A0ABM6WPW1_9RHOB|nr:lytic transglycosylase domain-containing protein [Paracoccus mutanolyticus]AWX92640.1 lytic transglycosylase domain-containing protein [Paracoccus mutanolyticus]
MFARSAARRLARVALALSLGLGLAVPAMADGLRIQKSGKSRIAQFERQTRLLDSRLAGQYQQSARLRPKGTSTKSVVDLALPGTIPAYSGNRRSQYLPHARAMARKHGVPEDLFLRLVQQESGWNPSARSNKGARGLAQLMPGTAAKLGVDASDPIQNLDGGARYLLKQLGQFGSMELALAAYNAGPGAVQKYNGIPPYRETQDYVTRIRGS